MSFPASTFFIFVFSIQLTVSKCSVKSDWIRTADLWCWKQPFCQMSNNRCTTPIILLRRHRLYQLSQNHSNIRLCRAKVAAPPTFAYSSCFEKTSCPVFSPDISVFRSITIHRSLARCFACLGRTFWSMKKDGGGERTLLFLIKYL